MFKFQIGSGKNITDFAVFSHEKHELLLFMKQHNILINESYIEWITDEEFYSKYSNKEDLLRFYKFRSNKNNEVYNVMTSKYLLNYALQLVGDHISDNMIFGPAIFRDDIEFIKLISDLINKLPFIEIMDYELLDMDTIALHDSYEWKDVKHDKLFNKDIDAIYDLFDTCYVYEALNEAFEKHEDDIQPITIEAYIRAFVEYVINQSLGD